MKKPLWKRILALFLAVVMLGSICYSGYLGVNYYLDKKDSKRQASKDDEETSKILMNEESMEKLNTLITETENGEYEKAMNLYEELAKTYPEENLLRFYRGNIYFYQDRYSEAIEEYLAAVQGHEDVASIYTFIGLSYVGLQDDEKAAPYLEKGLASEETDESGYQQCIQCYVNLGNIDKAMEIAKQYQTLYPDSGMAYLNLGNVYLLKEDNENAQENYKKALAKETDSETILRLNLNIAECLLASEKYEESIAYYNKYLTDVEEGNEEIDSVQLHYGIALIQTEKYEEALDVFDRCSESFSEYPDVLFEKSLCYYILKEYDQTIETMEQYYSIPNINPSGDGYVYYGISLYERDRYEEAEQAFRTGMNAEEWTDVCLYYLGSIDIFREEYQQAVEDYTALLQYDYETETVTYNRGVAYLNLGELEKAKEDFTTVVEKGVNENLIANAKEVLAQLEVLGGKNG